APPLRAGTRLTVTPGDGDWKVEPDSVELDAIPLEELRFVARSLTVPRGRVRGRVVDELGEPLPFLALSMDDETLETDARGEFLAAEMHAKGSLSFSFPGSNWSYDLGGFDPERDEPVTAVARFGPTLFLDLQAPPAELGAAWLAHRAAGAAGAVELTGG